MYVVNEFNVPPYVYDVSDHVVIKYLIALQNFVLRVASHFTLSQDKIFHAFLKQEYDWRDLVFATDFYSKVRVFDLPVKVAKFTNKNIITVSLFVTLCFDRYSYVLMVKNAAVIHVNSICDVHVG